MGKIFTVLVISVCAASTCFALGLELSDVIKEAREIEQAKLSQTKEDKLQPVQNKNVKVSQSGEQSACEKISIDKTNSNYSK